MTPREARIERALAGLALLAGVAGAAFALKGADRVERAISRPPALRADFPVIVDVPRGAPAAAVIRLLEAEHLVADGRVLRAWLAATGLAGRLQAGEYAVERPLSIEEIGRLLVSGRVVLHPVTVPEGLDLEETAARMARSGPWPEADLLAAFRDPTPLRELGLDPDATDLEGYLFPDTYNFPRDETAQAVARAMVVRFRAAWTEALARTGLAEGSPAAGGSLRVREIATLASLVEKETGVAAEYPLVAGVYANRLRLGMRLECDPTVIAALERDGKWTGGPLLRKDLSHPSPWNTYVVAGLPPGPIASFGLGALTAALAPAETDALFFVATGDGGHRFAATLAEHDRNVAAYRRHEREAGRR